MASKRKSLKKKSPAKAKRGTKRAGSGDLARARPKNKALAKRGSTPRRAASTKKKASAQKAAATRGASERAKEARRFADAAGKRYGRNSQTAKRLQELAAEARRWELEAKRAKSVSAKQRARAKAGKARDAARNSFQAATREATHGQARPRGWQEVRRFDRTRSEVDTFSSYEHARHGAGSVLSLLESRPGIVGILSHRRVTQIESRNPAGLTASGELKPQLKQRADDVATELGLSPKERRELEELLIEAELYGVELELEVENYVEGTA